MSPVSQSTARPGHAHPALPISSGEALPGLPSINLTPFSQRGRDLLFQPRVFHCKLIVSGMCGVPLIGIHSEASTCKCCAGRRASADTAIHGSGLGSSPRALSSPGSPSPHAVPALCTSAPAAGNTSALVLPPWRFMGALWLVGTCSAGLWLW